jgi:diguanylate cyclase (GGDEF)-like protein
MEVDRQKRYPSPLSLLMIDIDYFKNYNDTNGHLAGDQVLKAISIIIQHAVRQTDMVSRYGGEEFCAILINTNKEGAIAIAERVRRNVAETNFPNEKVQPNGDLTVSIGVVFRYVFNHPLIWTEEIANFAVSSGGSLWGRRRPQESTRILSWTR